MSVCVTIYIVTAEELARFQADPATIEDWLRGLRPSSAKTGSLLEYWRPLHRFLTAGRRDDEMPWAALQRGDVRFPAVEDGAHAIVPATTRALAAVLAGVNRGDIEAWVAHDTATRPRGTAFPTGPDAPRRIASMVEQRTSELWVYFRSLQSITDQAASAGSGLVFQFWEGW